MRGRVSWVIEWAWSKGGSGPAHLISPLSFSPLPTPPALPLSLSLTTHSSFPSFHLRSLFPCSPSRLSPPPPPPFPRLPLSLPCRLSHFSPLTSSSILPSASHPSLFPLILSLSSLLSTLSNSLPQSSLPLSLPYFPFHTSLSFELPFFSILFLFHFSLHESSHFSFSLFSS